MTDYQEPYRWNTQNSGTDRCECDTSGWYANPLYTRTVQSATFTKILTFDSFRARHQRCFASLGRHLEP